LKGIKIYKVDRRRRGFAERSKILAGSTIM